MFSEWGSGLSGPASVIFTVLALFASTSTQKIAYGILAAFIWVFSAYRIWSREHDARLKEIERREDAEERFREGQPILTLLPNYTKIGPDKRSDPLFMVNNSGARAARWVRVKALNSQRGKYRLYFGEIAVLPPGKSENISCRAEQENSSCRVWDFFTDMERDAVLGWFDATIECRDVDESSVSTVVRICYDRDTQSIYVTAVPYTQRPPERGSIH